VALDRITVAIDGGALVAIMAPSGAGKSTLLHVIGGMDRVDSGRIDVGGRVVTSLSKSELVSYRRTVGFVFQQFHLLSALTALQNVLVPLMPYHPKRADRQRALDLLDLVGMSGRAHALPSQLSGGQQQRIAIARALVNKPSLLLADEPTGNLDSETGADVIELIQSARSEFGTTVLIATHDMAVAGACDRILRLRDGRLTGDSASP
jgi:putative ABC transport system ATP-binding protein